MIAGGSLIVLYSENTPTYVSTALVLYTSTYMYICTIIPFCSLNRILRLAIILITFVYKMVQFVLSNVVTAKSTLCTEMKSA